MPYVPYAKAMADAGFGPARGLYEPVEEPSFMQTVESSFEDSNLFFGIPRLLRRGEDGRPPLSLEFNPFDPENHRGTPFENHPEFWSMIADTRTTDEILQRGMELQEDLENREILSRAGPAGAVSLLMAGALSPESWIPLGYGLKSSAGLIRRAAVTSSSNAALMAGAELALHEVQGARTAEESAFAVGGALVLGGMMGTLGSLASAADFQRAVKYLETHDLDPAGIRVRGEELAANIPKAMRPAAEKYRDLRERMRRRSRDEISEELEARAPESDPDVLVDLPKPPRRRGFWRAFMEDEGEQMIRDWFGGGGGRHVVPPNEADGPPRPRLTIHSGGQTGADRGALEGARAGGAPTGGVAPKGFRTERGPDPSLAEFGLREGPTADWNERTRDNVVETDGTLLFNLARRGRGPGSDLTLRLARELGKPLLVVEPGTKIRMIVRGQESVLTFANRGELLGHVSRWIEENAIAKLNVAGNRESRVPGLQARVSGFIRDLVRAKAPVMPDAPQPKRGPRVRVMEGVSGVRAAAKAGQGVDTLRPGPYGNPFPKGGGAVHGAARAQAVADFDAWLRGTDHTDFAQAKRREILRRIDAGELDAADLLYYTDEAPNHAEALARFAQERRAEAAAVPRGTPVAGVREPLSDVLERASEQAKAQSLDDVVIRRAERAGRDPGTVPEGTTTDRLPIAEFLQEIQSEWLAPRLEAIGIRTLTDLRRAFLMEHPGLNDRALGVSTTTASMRKAAFTQAEHDILGQEAISVVRSDPTLLHALASALRRRPDSLRGLLEIHPDEPGRIVIPAENLDDVQAVLDQERRELTVEAAAADQEAQAAHAAAEAAHEDVTKRPESQAARDRLLKAADELDEAEGKAAHLRATMKRAEAEAASRPSEAARRGRQRLKSGKIDPSQPVLGDQAALTQPARPASAPEFDPLFERPAGALGLRVRHVRRPTAEKGGNLAEPVAAEYGTVIGVRGGSVEVRFDRAPREQLEVDLEAGRLPENAAELRRLRERRLMRKSEEREPDTTKPVFGRSKPKTAAEAVPGEKSAAEPGLTRLMTREQLEIATTSDGAPVFEAPGAGPAPIRDPKGVRTAAFGHRTTAPMDVTPLYATPQTGERTAEVMGVDAGLYSPDAGRKGNTNRLLQQRERLATKLALERRRMIRSQRNQLELFRQGFVRTSEEAREVGTEGASRKAMLRGRRPHGYSPEEAARRLAKAEREHLRALGALKRRHDEQLAKIDRQLEVESFDPTETRTRVIQSAVLGTYDPEKLRLDNELALRSTQLDGLKKQIELAEDLEDAAAVEQLSVRRDALMDEINRIEELRSQMPTAEGRIVERQAGDPEAIRMHAADETSDPPTDRGAAVADRLSQLRRASVSPDEWVAELDDMADQLMGLPREHDLTPDELRALQSGDSEEVLRQMAERRRDELYSAGFEDEGDMVHEAMIAAAEEARLSPHSLFAAGEAIDPEGQIAREAAQREAGEGAAGREPDVEGDDLIRAGEEAEAADEALGEIDETIVQARQAPRGAPGRKGPRGPRRPLAMDSDVPFYRLQALLGVDPKKLKWWLSWSPKLRTLLSANPDVVAASMDLVTNDLHMERHLAGQATPHSVEDRLFAKKALLINLLERIPREYDRYAKRLRGANVPTQGTVGGAMLERARRKFNGPAGQLGYRDFLKEIGKAMIMGDEHAIPEIKALAQEIRKRVYNPALKKMLELNMLPQGLRPEIARGYLTRLWKIAEIKAREPEFLDMLSGWLVSKGESPEEAPTLAREYMNHILMTPEGRISYDPPEIFQRGTRASHGRPIDIPDQELLAGNWIDSDIDTQLRYFFRSIVPDILLAGYDTMKRNPHGAAEFYPDPKLRKLFEEMARDYDRKIQQAPEGQREVLSRHRDRDMKDLDAMVQELRGTLGMPADPDSVVWRSLAAARRYNVMLDMGTFMLSSLPDLARPFMLYGTSRVFGTMMKGMVQDWKTFKLNARETKAFGTAADIVLNTRPGSIFDLGDTLGSHTRLERGIRAGADLMGLVSLLAPWTAVLKQWVGGGVAQMMAEDLLRVGAMNAAEQADLTARLAKRGIDPEMAGRITAQLQARVAGGHMTRDGMLHIDTQSWTDRDAAFAWGTAIRREVDLAIITPTAGDKPIFMSSEAGRFFTQYKSYAVAAASKSLLLGAQRPDRAFWNGAAISIALGMTAVQMKAWTGGWPTPGMDSYKDVMWWFRNGVDRSGLFGFPADINNTVGIATRGGLSAGRILMAGADPGFRFTNRNLLTELVGPFSQTVLDLGETGAGFGDLLSGYEPSRASRNAAYRLIPYNNLWYLRRVTETAFRRMSKLGLEALPLEKPIPAAERKRRRQSRAEEALVRETAP